MQKMEILGGGRRPPCPPTIGSQLVLGTKIQLNTINTYNSISRKVPDMTINSFLAEYVILRNDNVSVTATYIDTHTAGTGSYAAENREILLPL